jgi:HEAT repeat-containing protein 6
MLDGQKAFLLQAVQEQGSSASGSSSSFTPMSSRLGIMIREIHNALCKAIDGENRPNTLVQIIKCVVVVVTNTPYENMQRGLLSSLTNRLMKLYNSHPHSSTSTPDNVLAMQRAALSCLAAVISAVSKDQTTSASSNKSAPTKNAAEEVSELIKGSILSQVLAELTGNAPSPLQPELLRVVGSISGSFFDLVFDIWQDIFKIVLKAVSASVDAPDSLPADPAIVRLNAVKIVEDATASVLSKLEGDSSISSRFSQMWQEVIHSPLLNLTTDRSSQVRSSMCNVLSQIPGPIFASLKPATRIMCTPMLQLPPTP